MKVRLTVLIVSIMVVTVALSGCGGSKAVKAQGASPAVSSATQGSKTVPDAAKKDARVISPVSGQKQAGQPAAQSMVVLKDVHFDFDKYTIRPADTEILKQDYAWFKANPAARVTIEGNCDERGSIEYNLALGQKRADAAKTFLVTLGVPGNALNTISYGKEKPVDPGHDEQAWAKNRRDHLAPQK